MKTSVQVTIKQWIADRLKHGRPISYSEAIAELLKFQEEYYRIETENKQLLERIEVLRLAKMKRRKE